MVGRLQGVEDNSRLPASTRGNPADDDSAERLPESLQEAIQSYLNDSGQ